MNLSPVSYNINRAYPSFKSDKALGQENSSNTKDNKGDLLLAGAAALALSAAAIAGIAMTSGKNKIPSEVANTIKASQEFQTVANDAVEKITAFSQSAREKFNTLYTLFKNNGIDANGNQVAKITDFEDGIVNKVMEEFYPDGSLLRRTTFSITKNPVKMEEFPEGGKKNILTYDWFEGNCAKYIEGEKTLPDGTITIDRQLNMGRNFQPEEYFENYTKTHNSTHMDAYASLYSGFGSGLNKYYKDYSYGAGVDLSVGEGIVFERNNVDMYVLNDKVMKGLETIERELNFKKGNPVQCTIESREISDGEVVFKHRYIYDDKTGQWDEVNLK